MRSPLVVQRPRLFLLLSLALLFPDRLLRAQEADPAPARFLGSASCASASCHGGADAASNQHLTWKTRDFHTRAQATLSRRRSEMLAEFLRLPDAASAAACTVCHAPFRHLPARLRGPELPEQEAVSCESCHGPAEPWIRSHTRPDFSHADRVAAGLRDLRHLYGRANSCVGCHQNLSSDLLRAGHPELIFELDGQSASQPRHWRERDPEHGPKAWLTGQAVALRELSAQLLRESNPADSLPPRWAALVWLLQRAAPAEAAPPAAPLLTPAPPAPAQWQAARDWSDRLARLASSLSWTPAQTRQLVAALSSAPAADDQPPLIVQARRAELTALALDRLLAALLRQAPDDAALAQASTALDDIFAAVQSLPDFNPETYAQRLARFRAALGS